METLYGSESGGKAAKPAVCQVPGCSENIPEDKAFLKRCRICQTCMRQPSIVVGGRTVRFCNLCKRLQKLDDFDADRKSCRDSLMKHNARRRKRRSEAAAGAGSGGGAAGSGGGAAGSGGDPYPSHHSPPTPTAAEGEEQQQEEVPWDGGGGNPARAAAAAGGRGPYPNGVGAYGGLGFQGPRIELAGSSPFINLAQQGPVPAMQQAPSGDTMVTAGSSPSDRGSSGQALSSGQAPVGSPPRAAQQLPAGGSAGVAGGGGGGGLPPGSLGRSGFGGVQLPAWLQRYGAPGPDGAAPPELEDLSMALSSLDLKDVPGLAFSSLRMADLSVAMNSVEMQDMMAWLPGLLEEDLPPLDSMPPEFWEQHRQELEQLLMQRSVGAAAAQQAQASGQQGPRGQAPAPRPAPQGAPGNLGGAWGPPPTWQPTQQSFSTRPDMPPPPPRPVQQQQQQQHAPAPGPAAEPAPQQGFGSLSELSDAANALQQLQALQQVAQQHAAQMQSLGIRPDTAHAVQQLQLLQQAFAVRQTLVQAAQQAQQAAGGGGSPTFRLPPPPSQLVEQATPTFGAAPPGGFGPQQAPDRAMQGQYGGLLPPPLQQQQQEQWGLAGPQAQGPAPGYPPPPRAGSAPAQGLWEIMALSPPQQPALDYQQQQGGQRQQGAGGGGYGAAGVAGSACAQPAGSQGFPGAAVPNPALSMSRSVSLRGSDLPLPSPLELYRDAMGPFHALNNAADMSDVQAQR